MLVNAKWRQLRFGAFGVVNKLQDQFPRVKVAIIKRAYWRKVPDPKNAWCNNPEAAWTAVPASFLSKAEDLLHYAHQSAEIARQIAPATNEKQDLQKRVCVFTQCLISRLPVRSYLLYLHTRTNLPWVKFGKLCSKRRKRAFRISTTASTRFRQSHLLLFRDSSPRILIKPRSRHRPRPRSRQGLPRLMLL